MSADATWRRYADENLEVARLALGSGYYNACLQNIQQAVEKYLKAALIKRSAHIKRTHNIELLNSELNAVGINVELTDEECELIDAIYIPSKYPTGGVLPDFSPDQEICRQCIDIATKVRKNTERVGTEK